MAGALGSFTWGDGGSDSPWLPGAPIAVGVGRAAHRRPCRRPPGQGLDRRTRPGGDGGWRRRGRDRRRRGDAHRLPGPGSGSVVGPGRGHLRRRPRIGGLLLGGHGSMTRRHRRGTLPSPMPTSTRHRLPRLAICAALVVVAAACSNPVTSGDTGRRARRPHRPRRQRRQDDAGRLGRERRRGDPDQAAQGQCDLDRDRPPGRARGRPRRRHVRDERPGPTSARRWPGGPSTPRTRAARHPPARPTSRPGNRPAAATRCSPATSWRATASASC